MSQGSTPTSLGALPTPVLNNFKTGNFPEGPRSFPCPTPLFQEAAGAEGFVWVPVPASLTDRSQIKKCLGSSSDLDNYLEEFKYLFQSYDLTWHDVYIILSFTLLPEERERAWQTSQVQADEIHRSDDMMSVGATAVPPEVIPTGIIRETWPSSLSSRVCLPHCGPSKGRA